MSTQQCNNEQKEQSKQVVQWSKLIKFKLVGEEREIASGSYLSDINCLIQILIIKKRMITKGSMYLFDFIKIMMLLL